MSNGLSYNDFFNQFSFGLPNLKKNDQKAIKLFKCIFKRKCTSKQIIQSCQSLNDCKQLKNDLADNT